MNQRVWVQLLNTFILLIFPFCKYVTLYFKHITDKRIFESILKYCDKPPNLATTGEVSKHKSAGRCRFSVSNLMEVSRSLKLTVKNFLPAPSLRRSLVCSANYVTVSDSSLCLFTLHVPLKDVLFLAFGSL